MPLREDIESIFNNIEELIENENSDSTTYEHLFELIILYSGSFGLM